MTEIQDAPFVLDLSCPDAPGMGIKVAKDFQWPTDTEGCIALSARKWRFIALCCRALKQKVVNGTSDSTCALCHQFGGNYVRGGCCDSASETCPVRAVVETLGCRGTLFDKYTEAVLWADAAAIADDFAAFLGQLKPVPKIPSFKGFCVGNSHDGYVGLHLVKHDGMGVILEADIPAICNELLVLDNHGLHLCKNIASNAPFKDLLDAKQALKINDEAPHFTDLQSAQKQAGKNNL